MILPRWIFANSLSSRLILPPIQNRIIRPGVRQRERRHAIQLASHTLKYTAPINHTSDSWTGIPPQSHLPLRNITTRHTSPQLYRAPNRTCCRPYISARLAAIFPTHPHPCSRLFTHPACCVLAPHVHSLPAISQTPINYRQLPAATTSTQLQPVPCLACRPAQVCLSLHIERPVLSASKFACRYFSPRYCLSIVQYYTVLRRAECCNRLQLVQAAHSYVHTVHVSRRLVPACFVDRLPCRRLFLFDLPCAAVCPSSPAGESVVPPRATL